MYQKIKNVPDAFTNSIHFLVEEQRVTECKLPP